MTAYLSHAGMPFHGIPGELQLGPWDLQTKNSKFFGVVGETAINGEIGGREIACEIWLFNSYATPQALDNAIESINSYTGQYGTLAKSSPGARSFPRCQFLGCAPKRGPIPDPDRGYIMIAELRFRQLSPD
jgi:hypothetical protein